MDEKTKVIGIDIGGTKIAVCLADGAGHLLDSGRIPTAGGVPYETALSQLIQLIQEIIGRNHLTKADISCCGISAPGPLDMVNGKIPRSPNLSWEDVAIRDDVANGIGVRTVLENDANAGVLAEYFFGTARGKKDAVYLTMSTGVGGGVITNGQLLTGKTGIGAELGHLILDVNGPICNCGLRGCFEAYCGGRAVAQRIQAMLANHPENPMLKLPGVDGKLENLSFQSVRDGAKAGIPVAVEMWDEICMRLAQGIGVVMTTFNPEIIILGTAAYYAGDFLLQPVLHYLPRFAWQEFRSCCKVCITELGPKVGELAGASVALFSLEKENQQR